MRGVDDRDASFAQGGVLGVDADEVGKVPASSALGSGGARDADGDGAGAGDVDEGLRALGPELRRDEKAVAALGGDVARRALALGAELARDPAVQRAIAARAGCAEAETEAETLRKMVATLSAELEELRGERGGGDEALAKSLETQREALAFDGGELEDVPSLASEASAADPIDELFARLDGGDFADGGADGETPGGAATAELADSASRAPANSRSALMGAPRS